eukprot:TRINITY_DN13131_c0_g1_i1.p1 TRINITY_DN13131_c0_g1~~TRINITY_DN13131_c0_g1_i1.p1  ORF type:complete len:329 (+),score=66.75 TRINITY_DN13131_c0_g1_i1:45-989(+)
MARRAIKWLGLGLAVASVGYVQYIKSISFTVHPTGAVLVTGSGTGIGKATALLLDKRGYIVYAGVRSQAHADELRAEASGKLQPIILDVSNREHISSAKSRIEADCRASGVPFVGLVNNAGHSPKGPAELLPESVLRETMETHYFGAVFLTQALLPLTKQHKGRIINISSTNYICHMPGFAAYTAAKGALEGFTATLREEMYRFGVSVSIVQPALTKTPLLYKDPVEKMQPAMDPHNQYGYLWASLRESEEELIKHVAVEPAVVAEAIVKALTDARPKTRYFTGESKAISYGIWWCSDRFVDVMTLKFLKIYDQ